MGPTLRISDWVGLGWGPLICMLKFSCGSDAIGAGTMRTMDFIDLFSYSVTWKRVTSRSDSWGLTQCERHQKQLDLLFPLTKLSSLRTTVLNSFRGWEEIICTNCSPPASILMCPDYRSTASGPPDRSTVLAVYVSLGHWFVHLSLGYKSVLLSPSCSLKSSGILKKMYQCWDITLREIWMGSWQKHFFFF